MAASTYVFFLMMVVVAYISQGKWDKTKEKKANSIPF